MREEIWGRIAKDVIEYTIELTISILERSDEFKESAKFIEQVKDNIQNRAYDDFITTLKKVEKEINFENKTFEQRLKEILRDTKIRYEDE